MGYDPVREASREASEPLRSPGMPRSSPRFSHALMQDEEPLRQQRDRKPSRSASIIDILNPASEGDRPRSSASAQDGARGRFAEPANHHYHHHTPSTEEPMRPWQTDRRVPSSSSSPLARVHPLPMSRQPSGSDAPVRSEYSPVNSASALRSPILHSYSAGESSHAVHRHHPEYSRSRPGSLHYPSKVSSALSPVSTDFPDHRRHTEHLIADRSPYERQGHDYSPSSRQYVPTESPSHAGSPQSYFNYPFPNAPASQYLSTHGSARSPTEGYEYSPHSLANPIPLPTVPQAYSAPHAPPTGEGHFRVPMLPPHRSPDLRREHLSGISSASAPSEALTHQREYPDLSPARAARPPVELDHDRQVYESYPSRPEAVYRSDGYPVEQRSSHTHYLPLDGRTPQHEQGHEMSYRARVDHSLRQGFSPPAESRRIQDEVRYPSPQPSLAVAPPVKEETSALDALASASAAIEAAEVAGSHTPIKQEEEGSAAAASKKRSAEEEPSVMHDQVETGNTGKQLKRRKSLPKDTIPAAKAESETPLPEPDTNGDSVHARPDPIFPGTTPTPREEIAEPAAMKLASSPDDTDQSLVKRQSVSSKGRVKPLDLDEMEALASRDSKKRKSVASASKEKSKEAGRPVLPSSLPKKPSFGSMPDDTSSPVEQSRAEPEPPAVVSSNIELVPDGRMPYQPVQRVSAPDSIRRPLSKDELINIHEAIMSRRANPLRMKWYAEQRDLGQEPRDGFWETIVPMWDSAKDPQSLRKNGTAQMVGREHNDSSEVARHYNNRQETGRDARNFSPILPLKSFNNWVKSILINKFGRRGIKVMDMGGGKGGDLQKWDKLGIRELVLADIAATSVQQAEARYNERRHRFKASFHAFDCFGEEIAQLGKDVTEEPFDMMSLQFCMHYGWSSVHKARLVLENVARFLKPGGVFIGTIPNRDELYRRLDATEGDDLTFGNSKYHVRFDQREKKLYGHRYTFFLDDAVDEVPEFVVDWDDFVSLAGNYGLEPCFKRTMAEMWADYRFDAEFEPLARRMKVNPNPRMAEQPMEDELWEATTVYLAFAFEKVR